MARTGRPKIPINWTEVNKLLFIQCSEVQVASFIDVSVDTLNRAAKRDHGMTFAEYSSLKREKGLISLRQELWRKATDPKNTAATIFAAKAYLGLRDYDGATRKEIGIEIGKSTKVKVSFVDQDDSDKTGT